MNIIKEFIYILKYPKKYRSYIEYKINKNKRYKLLNCKLSDFEFPVFENPLVSIIIPVCNQYKYTVNCLYSILNTVKDISYEVIVADDCSTDLTKEINKHIKNIQVVKTTGNSGFFKNCNNACKYAKGEYIWLLNNDTQVLDAALKYLIETFKNHADAGAVGSKLISKNKRVQEAGGIIYQDAGGFSYGSNEKDIDKYELNYFKEVDYCGGASLLIKKDLWNKLNGFGEYFTSVYYEDADLCFRIRENGYKVYYQPKSEIIYYKSVLPEKSCNDLMQKNKKMFYEKWKNVLANQLPNAGYNFVARDRSNGKKVLLFADLGFLKPDTNCGNRSSYQYLKMLWELGFNVKYIGVGSDRKDVLYKELITDLGVEILDYENIENWFEKYGSYVDYIFINRPKVWNKLENYMKKYCNNCITIYQGHDIHYIREQREAKLSHNKKGLINSQKTEKIEKEIWKKADYVFYFSHKEIDIIKEYSPESKAYSVPLYLYPELNNLKKYDAKNRKDLIFVGSGHPPNKDAMEWFLSSIFPKLNLPDVKIYIVGKGIPKELHKYKSENVIFTGYVTDEELGDLYSKVRLAVIPLRFGAGVKGKVIEAVRYNVPVLTSDIGIEGINNDDNIITIANSECEFIEKINNIYNNYEFLNNIASKSNGFIKNNFSYEHAYSIISNILK